MIWNGNGAKTNIESLAEKVQSIFYAKCEKNNKMPMDQIAQMNNVSFS